MSRLLAFTYEELQHIRMGLRAIDFDLPIASLHLTTKLFHEIEDFLSGHSPSPASAPAEDPASIEALMRKLTMDFNTVNADFSALKSAITQRLASDAAKVDDLTSRIVDLTAKLAAQPADSDEAATLHQQIVDLTNQVSGTVQGTSDAAASIQPPASDATGAPQGGPSAAVNPGAAIPAGAAAPPLNVPSAQPGSIQGPGDVVPVTTPNPVPVTPPGSAASPTDGTSTGPASVQSPAVPGPTV